MMHVEWDARGVDGVGDFSQCIDEPHALRDVPPRVEEINHVAPVAHGRIAFNDRGLPPFSFQEDCKREPSNAGGADEYILFAISE